MAQLLSIRLFRPPAERLALVVVRARPEVAIDTGIGTNSGGCCKIEHFQDFLFSATTEETLIDAAENRKLQRIEKRHNV